MPARKISHSARIAARKAAARFDWSLGARNPVSERVMTVCMGTCGVATPHRQEDVVYSNVKRERICETCGHNKDAGK